MSHIRRFTYQHISSSQSSDNLNLHQENWNQAEMESHNEQGAEEQTNKALHHAAEQSHSHHDEIQKHTLHDSIY